MIAACAVIGLVLGLHRANQKRFDKAETERRTQFEQAYRDNKIRFDELDKKLVHQDKCLDELRASLAESMLQAAQDSRQYMLRQDFESEHRQLQSHTASEMLSHTQLIQKLIGDLAEVRVRVAEIGALQQTNIRAISDLLDARRN